MSARSRSQVADPLGNWVTSSGSSKAVPEVTSPWQEVTCIDQKRRHRDWKCHAFHRKSLVFALPCPVFPLGPKNTLVFSLSLFLLSNPTYKWERVPRPSGSEGVPSYFSLCVWALTGCLNDKVSFVSRTEIKNVSPVSLVGDKVSFVSNPVWDHASSILHAGTFPLRAGVPLKAVP